MILQTGAFLRDKTPQGQKKYKRIIDKAVRQQGPVIEYYKDEAADSFNVFVAYRKGSTHSFFSSTGELLKRCDLITAKKYVNNFSNGIVVVSLYFGPEVTEQAIQSFNEQLSLYVVSSSPLLFSPPPSLLFY